MLREQLGDRVEALDQRVEDGANVRRQQKLLRDDLEALDKRVKKLDEESSGGGAEADELNTRIDDLEQRVEDVENDDSNN